jgi:hypothetical protein
MFRSSRVIKGINGWHSITGDVIKDKIVIIKSIEKEIEISRLIFSGPYIFNSNYVKFEDCNKKFLNNNVRPSLFPNIKFLFLESEPPGEDFFHTWDFCTNNDFVACIHPDYELYLEKYLKSKKDSKWFVGNYN